MVTGCPAVATMPVLLATVVQARPSGLTRTATSGGKRSGKESAGHSRTRSEILPAGYSTRTHSSCEAARGELAQKVLRSLSLSWAAVKLGIWSLDAVAPIEAMS